LKLKRAIFEFNQAPRRISYGLVPNSKKLPTKFPALETFFMDRCFVKHGKARILKTGKHKI